MPITNQLLCDGRVYLSTYSADYTNAEIGEMVDELQSKILSNATHKVHTVSDYTSVQKLPPNSLSTAIKLMRRSHPMLGAVILVTPKDFIRRMIDILDKVTPGTTVIACGTVEEAMAEAEKLIAAEDQKELTRQPE